jgi:hypothetical protein
VVDKDQSLSTTPPYGHPSSGGEFSTTKIIPLDTVFDAYFSMMNLPPLKHDFVCGYSSWYNYYGKITQEQILRDLKGMDRLIDGRWEMGDGRCKDNNIIKNLTSHIKGNVTVGSAVFAKKPGDGSAREQAASCQRVLGGVANIAREYATKRYRSNLINWGMLPFISEYDFEVGDVVTVPDIRKKLLDGVREFDAVVVRGDVRTDIRLRIDEITNDELKIILSGCLMNYYKGNG